MARNEEKAQSMLNRFLAAKELEKRPPKRRRPFLASQCRDLADADRWRSQILREIGKKVQDIQNPGYDEHRLREMNDDINKLIREKWHWEARIIELGGPDYRKLAPKMTDQDYGSEAPEPDLPGALPPTNRGPGYRYFGAARQLPGVKELFEKPKEAAGKKKRSRHDMYKCIDADYYGYRDDEDGTLVQLESAAEDLLRKEALDRWLHVEAVKSEALKTIRSGEVAVVEQRSAAAAVFLHHQSEYDDEDGLTLPPQEPLQQREFMAYVPLPDQKEIEQMVVNRKKEEIYKQYLSDSILEKQAEAKELLNIKR